MFACRPKQKVRKLRGPIARLVGLLGVLTLISLTAGEAAAASRYQAAAVPAKPGLQCTLSPDKTSTAAAAVTVSTDHDGYARFYAVRATSQDAVQSLTLNCKDAEGAASTFAVDLTAAETFAAHPLDLAGEPGVDRPALKGDPMSYSQSQLLDAGYGLRPDPEDAAAYARWLAAALTPGRLLEPRLRGIHKPSGASNEVRPDGTTLETADPWVGSVLQGDPLYELTEATFTVPTAVPGGDLTTDTEVAIWNGLGGFGTGSGLIQGGVEVETTSTAAGYGIFREYCCGDPDSNGYGGVFAANPGDKIYSQEYYCDSKGNDNINGGYGCTFLQNLTSGAILNCTQASGSPCWSVKALPLCSVNPNATNCMTLGTTAEFIVENQSPQVSSKSTAFTDMTPVTISGSAYSLKKKAYETVSTDPSVALLTDFTDTTTRITVTLGTTDQTNFSVAGTAHTIRSFTGSPCGDGICDGWTTLDDNPLTLFIYASDDNLYQLHTTTGAIYKSTGVACSGTSCPGWTEYDINARNTSIAVDGSNLYKLENNGQIWKSNGTPCNSSGCPGWIMLDDNPLAVEIAASGGNLYERHSDGLIWKWTGVPCSGNSCPGWTNIGDNPSAVRLVADGASLYQLHSDGSIFKWDGGVCSGASCPWTKLDDNPLAVQIAAAGGHLYELHSDGKIYKSTGVACSGTSCPGWILIDDNPTAATIVAAGNDLYETHFSGSVFSWNGEACVGSTCRGWTELDANPLTFQIAAGGNHVYELF
jgi:hypothetical protein